MAALLFIVTVAAKGSLLLLVAWFVARLGVWSAARRHAFLVAAIAGHVAIPVFALLLPSVAVPLPGELLTRVGGAGSGAMRTPTPLEHEAAVPQMDSPTPEGLAARSTGSRHTSGSALPFRSSEAWSAVSEHTSRQHAGNREAAGVVRPGDRARFGPWVPWILGLWAAGALLLFVRVVRGWARAARWAARAYPLDRPKWARDLRQARLRLGFKAPVRLVARDGVGVPVSLHCGVPTVVVPREAEGWPAPRRQAVLLHEVAHLKRLDPWTRCLSSAVCALFWPSPFVWLASRAAGREAEQACDDEVVRAGLSPAAYLLELVELARDGVPARTLPATALAKRSQLEARARALLSSSLSRSPAGMRATVAIAVAGALAVACLAPLQPAVRGVGGVAAAGPGGGADDMIPCVYMGGPLRDRYLLRENGIRTWEAYWEGDGCSVRLEVRSSRPGTAMSWLARGGPLGVRLVPGTPDASIAAHFTTGADTRALRIELDDDGRARGEIRDGDGVWGFDPDGGPLLDDLLLQVDRLTAVAASVRVSQILSRDGPVGVLREAARTQGGHAAGVYLSRLLDERSLDGDQLAAALGIAADRVRNESVLVDLLRKVGVRYSLEEERTAAAFHAASLELRTRAGREEVARLLVSPPTT